MDTLEARLLDFTLEEEKKTDLNKAVFPVKVLKRRFYFVFYF